MYFKQILNEDSGCSSYVIASRQSKEAVVVDPALDVEQYIRLADRRGFRIVLIIDTHIHADHVSGARDLAELADAPVAMHASDRIFLLVTGPVWGIAIPAVSALLAMRFRAQH